MGEGEKNDKNVVRGYPVDKLPEELRRGIENGQIVRVTVESEAASTSTPKHSMRSFLGSAPGLYSSAQEVLDHIRMLRDESDR